MAKKKPKKTLLAVLDDLPPNVCRVVARQNNGWKPMSHADLAKRSGLANSTVAAISKRKTWRGLTVEVVEAFALACGVDHMHTKRTKQYLKRNKFIHLVRADGNARKMYAAIFKSIAS